MADTLVGDLVDTVQREDGANPSPLSQWGEDNDQDDLSDRLYVPVAEGLELEDIERYRPGDYHPTHIGDTFDNGRFRVLHKVGYSSRSLVWLARDLLEGSTLVTLKILIADISGRCKEDRILNALQSEEHGAESMHVPRLLHKFTIDGPNGSHICLVLPLIGPTICEYSAAQAKAGLSPYLPRDTAMNFSRQIVRVLAHLHSCGITHGDLKPANILVQLCNLDTLSDADIYSYLGAPKRVPLSPMSGEPTAPSAPSYGIVKANLASFGLKRLTNTVKIADFVDSFSILSPPEIINTTLSYAAPEILLEHKISRSSDVWSLGCTLFELRFLKQLFPSYDDPRDIVLRSMVEILGVPPEHQWQKWENRRTYFPEGGPLETRVGGRSCLSETIRRFNKKTMQDNGGRGALSEDEIECFEDLLSRLLKYEPKERITAFEAISHPWLQGENTSGAVADEHVNTPNSS
ncbi:hypothetical protein PRK78_001434 [Emydomyces testavorans]|uniref:Protein kinase domain-containing protein n=1 Tax=Emydomyces testavorans TaxID=2070801 RepID=A0AAF0DDB3_9EURO|nr:hypothetical protein PRK78_001434 [Emydomyces testavorans]